MNGLVDFHHQGEEYRRHNPDEREADETTEDLRPKMDPALPAAPQLEIFTELDRIFARARGQR